ncbi:TPA: hypothetical protein DEP58_02965 [Patescibacteria group bacterium]|nr:hypothetical protein [Patescibacteria group bacterium]
MSVLEIAWKQYLIDTVSESSRANNTTNKLADEYKRKLTCPRLSRLGYTLNSQEYTNAYAHFQKKCKKKIALFVFLLKVKSRLLRAS